MAINGNNILIYVNGAVVAGTRSNEVQSNRELIEIASPSSGEWRQFIAGRKDWGFTISWLVSSYSDIQQLLLNAGVVTVRLVGRGETLGLTGSAIVQTCRMTFTRGNLAQGSLQLKGNGPLTKEPTIIPIRP
jgi:predicted secreted protein